MPRLRSPLAICLLCWFVAACSSESNPGTPTPAPLKPALAECTSASECSSGICAATSKYTSVCAEPCAADGSCVDVEGKRTTCFGGACLPPCNSALAPLEGHACVDGVYTKCEDAPEAYCERCGCPSSGTYCAGASGCKPREPLGAGCTRDEQCASGRCSIMRVCEVLLGAECDPDSNECAGCYWTGTKNVCLEACNAYTSCPGDTKCFRREGDTNGRCLSPCHSYGSSLGCSDGMECTAGNAEDGWYCH